MTQQKTISLPMNARLEVGTFFKGLVALLQNQDAVEGRMCGMKVNADRASVAKLSQKSQRATKTELQK